MPQLKSPTIKYGPSPKQEEMMLRDAIRKRKVTLKSLTESAEKEGGLIYQGVYGKKKK